MVEIVSVPLSLDDLAAAELQEMLAYWQGLARDRVAPSWHEVEPLEMPAKLLPYLTVVEVHQSPLDFVYVFYGTGHLALKARDLTGHSINDTLPNENCSIVFEQYRRTLEARKPMAFRRRVTDTDMATEPTQTTLRLPLSADGETINWIMSLSDLRGSPEMRGFYQTYGRERPFRALAAAR
mgnify:FL=1